MTDIDWEQLEADRHSHSKASLGRRIDLIPDLEAYALQAKRQLEAADRLAQACSNFFNAADHLEFLDRLDAALVAYEATKGGDA